MAIGISSAFDSGNIRLVAIDGDRIDLEIVKDSSNRISTSGSTSS